MSPIHPNLATTKNRNTTLPQVTLQSTAKPSVAPKYSHMDYQTYRPMTKPSRPQKMFTRSNFAEHSYNYKHSSKTNPPPRKNNNHVCSHYSNLPNTSTNSVNFQNISHSPQDYSEITHFSNKIRTRNKHLIARIVYHLMMMIIINQTFLQDIHKNIAHKNHDNLNHTKI